MTTAIVINQPKAGMMVGSVQGHRDWNSGLFGCCSDCKSLLLTYCCLPCAICTVASKVGECMCMPYFVPGGLLALRTRIRTLGGIKGSICMDSIALTCCPLCTLCQMQSELHAMGL
ncbi:placenta-specific gene 8 protein-like [Dreissena polymorpha]|uniref:Cornifelin n=1 Tax=Dreissena polymorpha TaxID=45954 RepID=A0A9D4CQT2_DREPO|nr:placenta-specific gene 8 protein-like [Dreissena polymorpha]XP_052243386.1 placenta-specific gene 8 protein-like [Dreissena polymorpha]XP_052243388.1 placenta-specific gene 8 protein-like [Dreissena polymorpha]XP_052243389.1 placenta-specific gene 8 protein-like [Dreissena polymorpha]XP_052243390.1 placenta-specific gene 8 protein-like [Dreissena polymorpha]KAH3728708.1 hypothetical protein DPMN_054668 [Dreissena polymorpha]